VGDLNQYGVAPSGARQGLPGADFAVRSAARVQGTTLKEHSILENALVLCVLVFSTSAFVNLFPGEHGLQYDEQGLLFAQILWSFLYLAMLLLARKRIVEFVRLVWQSKLLVLLLGWVCLSIVWSIDRQLTIRHFVALLFTTFFGVYFGVRYDLRKQLKLLSVALGVVVVASVCACLAFPEYGIGSDNPLEQPAWQGVLSNKNNLATLVILAVLILILYFIRGIRRPLIVLGIVLLFFLVVLTQSKTALLYFALSIFAFPFLRAFQRNPSKRRKIVAFVLLIAAGLATWTYFNWENFTYSLGKDPGLTGRFVLWGLALLSIKERPLLGYGFDAFWSSYYGPAADIRIASGWLAGGTTQNGFLNLWLDLGFIGVLLFVLSFVITYRQALNAAKTTKSWEGLWPVTFLTFLFAYGLTEFSFLSRNNLYWILYVSTGLAVRARVIPERLQS
jgi:exopolysaccharide production protein ExoQ